MFLLLQQYTFKWQGTYIATVNLYLGIKQNR